MLAYSLSAGARVSPAGLSAHICLPSRFIAYQLSAVGDSEGVITRFNKPHKISAFGKTCSHAYLPKSMIGKIIISIEVVTEDTAECSANTIIPLIRACKVSKTGNNCARIRIPAAQSNELQGKLIAGFVLSDSSDGKHLMRYKRRITKLQRTSTHTYYQLMVDREYIGKQITALIMLLH